MKVLGKYWKVILSVVMLIAAVVVFMLVYSPAKSEYESESRRLRQLNSALQTSIAENLRYADVQDEIPVQEEALDESRLSLYEHFPRELKEEDQIMYVLYLEDLFGTEITFSFGSVSGIAALSDGAQLGALTLTVNYETDYEGFKDMIEYLATDSRITSIKYATLNYDPSSDRATGSLTLLCYVLDSDLLEYTSPDVTQPEVGKSGIFD